MTTGLTSQPTDTKTGSLDQGVGVIYVQNSYGFPTSPGFTIAIDGEQMLVTGISPTNSSQWTVTRGFNGTADVSAQQRRHGCLAWHSIR